LPVDIGLIEEIVLQWVDQQKAALAGDDLVSKGITQGK
jgi:hypothetical protein